MKIIFEVSTEYTEIINDIKKICDSDCICEEKENFNGEQLITIITLITPIVWEIVDKYILDKRVTISVELDDETTVTITSWSIERAKKKAAEMKKKWDEMNK